MKSIDIIICLFILFGIISGIKKGFVIQAGLLVGLVIAFFSTRYLADNVAYYMNRLFEIPEKALTILSFIICFSMILFCCHIIVLSLHKALHVICVGWLDHLSGAILGVIKAVLVLGILFIVIDAADKKDRFITRELKENSLLYKPVVTVTSFFFVWAEPEKWFSDIEKQVKKLTTPNQ
ncbi:MAG: CvpA family protein [Bacteroidales bacterium]|nr:CvpA family protein [Bacteroidales bacterium]MDD4822640.1 CvpA family protein [Bacteroidales bacterium]